MTVQEPLVAAMARAGYAEIRRRWNDTSPTNQLEPWEETPQALKDDWVAIAQAMRDAHLQHIRNRIPPIEAFASGKDEPPPPKPKAKGPPAPPKPPGAP